MADLDIRIVNGREVLTCVHCDGTGECQKAQKLDTGKGIGLFRPDKDWYECQTCGTGRIGAAFKGSAQRPLCTICGGKGFHSS
jgi:hypothetical protein